jgi:hypothetical protein
VLLLLLLVPVCRCGVPVLLVRCRVVCVLSNVLTVGDDYGNRKSSPTTCANTTITRG